MATANDELSCVYELIGQTLRDLGAHHEILILRFGEYEIHVSGFARIIHNETILLTTQDYQSWDGNDHKHNDMYLNIAKYGKSLIGQQVKAIEVSPVKDLFVTLDNDARIEIFNSNGSLHWTDEMEQWFFFKPKEETYPFLCICNTGAERQKK